METAEPRPPVVAVIGAAALGAEGLAADLTLLIGNGYAPGHADLALDLLRTSPGVRTIFQARTSR